MSTTQAKNIMVAVVLLVFLVISTISQCFYSSTQSTVSPIKFVGNSIRKDILELKSGSLCPIIIGVRLEDDSIKGHVNGYLPLPFDEIVNLRVFGINLVRSTVIRFTDVSAERGTDCGDLRAGSVFTLNPDLDSSSGTVAVHLEELNKLAGFYYVCVKDPVCGDSRWIHQGVMKPLVIQPTKKSSLWIITISVVVLQILSGLFAGLTLGLLSLDPTELQIVASVGNPTEKRYARDIIPLRNQSNFLLCSLVIGNVLVNCTLTILMDDIVSGVYAVVFSTIGIVIFGEIFPQAVCSRYGLFIGSKTRYITWAIMIITSPVSFPLSRILDTILIREIGTVYDRERLVELIKVTKDYNCLENEEVKLISGTLSLKTKQVQEIMTPLHEIFMLPYDAVLNFETLAEISEKGYSRIPVFEGPRSNIVGLLNIKDMALLDPDDCAAVKTLCKYYKYEICFVFDDTTLDVMLDEFRRGRSHMAFVRKVTNVADKDPFYETIGCTTLEDIIKDMIQSEIFDESERKSSEVGYGFRKKRKKDSLLFSARGPESSIITPQLQHAAFQYLSTTVGPFKPEKISDHFLRRLLKRPQIAHLIKIGAPDAAPTYIYKAGVTADYFVLILEGRVRVQVHSDSEGMEFDGGPFTHLGVKALSNVLQEERDAICTTGTNSSPMALGQTSERNLATPKSFVPDFSVYVLTDVIFLKIERSHYISAIRTMALDQDGKTDACTENEQTGTVLCSITFCK